MSKRPPKPPPQPCSTCGKPTERECSHVDCANRHTPTARPPRSPAFFPTSGERTVPHYPPGAYE